MKLLLKYAPSCLLRSLSTKNSDLYLLVFGLLFRLGLSPFSRDPWDMNVWQTVGSAILSGQNPYALTSNGLIYPPLWGAFCAASYLSYTLTTNPFLSYFTLKLPIVIADILISLIIKKTVYNHTLDVTKARAAMLLYLFNPVTIIVSSLWGMFDAIPTLFALLSLLYLSQGQYLKSGLTLGAGIGFKGFFPALLLPFFLFYIWKNEKRVSDCLSFSIYTALVPIVISIPFLITDSNTYISMILFPIKRLPQHLTYWFSISELLKANAISTATIISLSSVVSLSLFLALYLFLAKEISVWPMKSDQDKMSFILKGTILVIITFYLTSSTVNEQYFIWAIPFLILYIEIYNQSLKFPFYCLCILDTFFLFLNVGLSFFTPIADIPFWWTSFQYSAPSMALMILTGILFSVVCIIVFLKLRKPLAPNSSIVFDRVRKRSKL